MGNTLQITLFLSFLSWKICPSDFLSEIFISMCLCVSKRFRRLTVFNKITSHLYLGDLRDYRELMMASAIVPLEKPYLCVDARPFFNLLQSDPDGSELMVKPLLTLAVSLADLVRVGVNIYIYCQAGIERSPFLTALVLSELNRGTLDECYFYVKTKRPETMIYDNWVRAIEGDLY